jgi:hypothetical protein
VTDDSPPPWLTACTAVAALAVWVAVDCLHWHYIVGRYEHRIVVVSHDGADLEPSRLFYELAVDGVSARDMHLTVDRVWTVAALAAAVAFVAWLLRIRRIPRWTGAHWQVWTAAVLVTLLLNLMMRWYPTAVAASGPLHGTGWDTRNAAYPLWTVELALVLVTAAVSARLVLDITRAHEQ